MFKRFQGYRTFFHAGWLGLAGLVLSTKDVADQMGVNLHDVLADQLPAKDVGLGMVGLAVLFAYMRMITSTAAFHQDDDHHG